MKKIIWFVFLLIICNSCAITPKTPPVYSSGDTGLYMRISYDKMRISIEVCQTLDTIYTSTSYYIGYSKNGEKYEKITSINRNPAFTNARYRKEGENIYSGDDRVYYSSDNFFKENPKWEDFFEMLSPNFKNMNNAERANLLDSLSKLEKYK